jgi:hypothetical protein
MKITFRPNRIGFGMELLSAFLMHPNTGVFFLRFLFALHPFVVFTHLHRNLSTTPHLKNSTFVLLVEAAAFDPVVVPVKLNVTVPPTET